VSPVPQGPIGWGTVLPLLLKQLYQYYGDSGSGGEIFIAARGWVDFLHAHAQGLYQEGIGDMSRWIPKQGGSDEHGFFFIIIPSYYSSWRGFYLVGREDAEHYERLGRSR